MTEWFLEVVITVLLGVLIAHSWRATRKLDERQRTDHNDLVNKCHTLAKLMVKVETKTDIYLEHAGFSVPKVDRAILLHLEELERNDRPRLGCLDIRELYKDNPAKEE